MNIKLTNIHWTPKLHKNFTKARSIITGCKCSVKPLSKAVTGALKLIYNQIENYNFITQYYAVSKTCWLVQNNETVIDTISKRNSRNNTILFQHLISLLCIQIFHGRDKQFIRIFGYGAYWANNRQKHRLSFNKKNQIIF